MRRSASWTSHAASWRSQRSRSSLSWTGGEAPARVLPDLKQVLASRAIVPPIRLGDIPQQPQLPGDERADVMGNIVEAVRYVAQVRQGLQQQRHATTIGLSTAGQDELQIGRRQEEVLDQFLVGIRRFEVGIGTAHERPPSLTPGSRP